MRAFKVRIASILEMSHILDLCKRLHAVSPYAEVLYSEAAAKETLLKIMQEGEGVVLLCGSTGFLIARLIKPSFSEETIATEISWWSFREGRDKIREEQILHEAFEYWARNVARVKVIQTGSFQKSKWFTRRGYRECETGYIVRL